MARSEAPIPTQDEIDAWKSRGDTEFKWFLLWLIRTLGIGAIIATIIIVNMQGITGEQAVNGWIILVLYFPALSGYMLYWLWRYCDTRSPLSDHEYNQLRAYLKRERERHNTQQR